MVAAACGGGDNSDLDAYCALVRDGVGVGAAGGAEQAAQLDELLAVAPGEIRDAVLELENTTRSLIEIEEIDQLFDAAFDPDAQAARQEFVQFAVDSCGVSAEALPAGRVGSDSEFIADIQGYVNSNFAGAGWVPKVRYDIEREEAALQSISVTFVVEAGGDEASQACAALSVYLYELRGATGLVSVIDGGLVVVERQGPDGRCESV